MLKKERTKLTYNLKNKFQTFNGLLFANKAKDGWIPTSDKNKFNFYRDIIKPLNKIMKREIEPEASDINSMIKTLMEISELKTIKNKTCIHTPSQIINVLDGSIKENKEDGVQLGIKYNYKANAKQVKWWDEMFKKAIPEEDSRKAYYEMIGLSMITDKSQEVSYWITGKAGTGKSTIINSVINGIHHDYNTSNLQPDNWKTNNFTFYTIANKLVNISSDSSDNKRLETGMFKKLVSGEHIIADIKNISPITFENTALLISVGNNMPTISEKTDGPFRRMIPIPMNVVLKEEDKKKSIKKEIETNKDGVLEYIVSQGIKAVIALYKNGGPTIPKSAIIAIEELKDENSSIRQWLKDETTYTIIKRAMVGTAAYGLPFNNLGMEFNEWAKINGYRSVSSYNIRKQTREFLEHNNETDIEIYNRNNKVFLRLKQEVING